MKRKIGEMKLKQEYGRVVTLDIYQECEKYYSESVLNATPQFIPTIKSVQDFKGSPVNYHPEEMQIEIVSTGEKINVFEVNYIDPPSDIF